ncbi:MAG: beta-N-acetylhexosaminidase [Bacilli bacterium]|jgi:beta-N-acetylhexosaminidase|nr:beta-N-acetylhexosaminidase [Bacilli bacterium]
MRRKIVIFIGILSVLLISMFFLNFKSEKNPDLKVDKFINVDVDKDELLEKVNKKLNSMSLDEKIAQLFVVAWRDSDTYDDLYRLFRDKKLGGFILFRENMATYDKTKTLISNLQAYNDMPLIIGMDQEGGLVQRLKYLKDVKVTDIPYMYYLGKTKDENLAYQVGKVMARELRTIGVNVVFSPDIDIYSNPKNTVIGKRSFGSDYLLVNKMAGSLAKGLEETGVIPTYKHFPGHGDTDVDSHVDLPIINKSYEELKALELQTFSYAVNNNAKLIMVGHIALPNITGDNTPASLSKVLITDILKKDLNYNGLVITDALNMKALTDNYTQEEIIVKAIEAGVDILLMPDDIEKSLDYVKNNISEERINESVKKILMFKYSYLENYELLDKEYLGCREHKEIVSKIPKN